MDSPEHVVIPAFTVFEIELACKGYSKWEVGDVNENAKNKPRYSNLYFSLSLWPECHDVGNGVNGVDAQDPHLVNFCKSCILVGD